MWHNHVSETLDSGLCNALYKSPYLLALTNDTQTLLLLLKQTISNVQLIAQVYSSTYPTTLMYPCGR